MTAPAGSLRRLGRESLIYGLGTLLSRAASFIMLPVYTRLLTTADYGILQMLEMSLDVVSILISAGATAGVMRFYFAAQSDTQRRAVLGTAYLLQLGLNGLGSLAIVLAAGPIWRELLNGERDVSLVYIAAANFTIQALSGTPLLKAQIDGRAGLFTAFSVGRLVLQLTLNIVFLVGLGLGPKGILLSNLIASTVTGVASSLWFFRTTQPAVDGAAARDLWRFGLFYQLMSAGSFILTFGDRFFLERYLGLGELGVYGLAYQFGFLLASLTFTPFLRAWNPQRHQLAQTPAPARDALYNRAAVFYSLLTIAGATGIAIFVGPLLTIMSDPAFRPAALIVPVVVLAYTLQAWSDSLMFHMDVALRTKYLSIGTWLTVGVILVLYALLIPPFGGLGAAAATALAFAVRLGLLHHWGQQVFPVRYTYGPHLRLLGAGVLAYLAYRAVHPSGLVLQLVVGSACYLGFLALAWLALPPEAREALQAAARGSGSVVSRLLGSSAGRAEQEANQPAAGSS